MNYKITDGLLSFEQQITVPQLIYLDFDGEQTSYNNDALDLHFDVKVEASEFSEEDKKYILSELTEKYAQADIIFTLEKPEETTQFSTVFIGENNDFDAYGSFAGVAETIDKGNQIKNDNAFVFTDHSSDLDSIISVIDHELGHVVTGQEHPHSTGSLEDYSYTLDIEPVEENLGTSSSDKTVEENWGTLSSDKTVSVTVPFTGTRIYTFKAGVSGPLEITVEKQGSTNLFFMDLTTASYDYFGGIFLTPLNWELVKGREYLISIKAISKSDVKFFMDFPDSSSSNPTPSPSVPDNPPQSEPFYPNENPPQSEPFYPNENPPQSEPFYGSPDLTVSAGSNNSLSLGVGSSYTMAFSIVNNGNDYADASTAYIYCNNKVLATVPIAGIAAGGQYYASFSLKGSDLGAGSYTLYIKADGGNVISESNENNNTSGYTYLTFNAPSSPDLTISSFTTSAFAVNTNQQLTLDFTVYNSGNASAGASEVYIYDGSTYIGKTSIKSLSAGASATASFTISAGTLSAGTHSFSLKADGGNAVSESNENNNSSSSRTVTVSAVQLKPDLIVSNISFTPSTITTSQELRCDFTIENIGNADADAEFYIDLLDGQQYITSVLFKNLAAGSSKGYYFTLDPGILFPGNHSLWFKIDPTDKIAESNENNNSSSKQTVLVTAPPPDDPVLPPDDPVLPGNHAAGVFQKLALSNSFGTLVFSNNNFATSARLPYYGSGADIAGLPNGACAWQALSLAGTVVQSGTLQGKNAGAEIFTAPENDKIDIFFAQTAGKWSEEYAARHLGNTTGWSGTSESVMLYGKNKIEDIFYGSADSNTLFLTDDADGDALFLDDIFTNSSNQARLQNIEKIFAGNGNDIIDFTSSRFNCEKRDMAVYGGDGDDVIWANSNNNVLYGDAGNDRIAGGSGNDHIIGGSGNDSLNGGGGDDAFYFGGNWGCDTIEQLAGGSVTLYIDRYGSWDDDAKIYSCGENTISITGTTNINFRIGIGGTLPENAFDAAASTVIFK